MTLTSRWPISVRGVRLDTLAHNIEMRDGLTMMPRMRGASEIIPGKHGSIWVPGRRREEGRVWFDMWADGVDEDGKLVTLDGYQQWRKNMDKLYRLFDTSFDQALIEEQISPTDIRQALVECSTGIDPVLGGSWYAKFRVECIINDSFWESKDTYTYTSLSGGSAMGTHTLSTFATSTAPMEDLTITVKGPLTNPKLIDVRTGHSLLYEGALTSAQSWVVDTKAFTSVIGQVSQTAKTVAVGAHLPRYFAISPNPAGPQVSIEGTGAGTGTQLTITGRRKFL